ncbi:MAG: hypothetical protein V2I25_15110 [Woeseiaceae bacterium]|nr:hypothetical protein [Woeseiaceae bacterium]
MDATSQDLLVWTPWGLSGLIAWLAAWLAAGFILRTAPDPSIRRRFSLLLFIEGVMIVTSSSGPALWIASAEGVRLVSLAHFANDWLLLAVYLPAVSVAVDSRLFRPFRNGPGVWMLGIIGIGGAAFTLARPDLFVADVSMAPPNFGPVLLPTPGRAWPIVAVLLALSYTYGFIATLLSWLRARSPVAKRRTGALALAFGTRDLFWGAVFLGFGLFPENLPIIGLPLLQLASFALLFYVLVTAYGIASAHLFDIDIRIKWTLERGTIAAVFVAVFFVVSEGAATILSDRLGSVLGLLATGALVFFLAPLHRASERLSGVAMPNVTDTPEYRAFRKEQIYSEALAEALKDGDVTPVERAILTRLRISLELDEDVATRLETIMTRSTSKDV